MINDLIDKCLITVSDNRLEMHDLLLTMGKEVGYESSIKEAGLRGRLWDQEDICRVLKYKTVSHNVSFVRMNVVLSTIFSLLNVITFPGHCGNQRHLLRYV